MERKQVRKSTGLSFNEFKENELLVRTTCSWSEKLDGTEYSSIYLILCGLHRHLGENGIYDKNFLDEKNVYFARFSKVLNARMRTLNEKGLGFAVKRADPILPEQ